MYVSIDMTLKQESESEYFIIYIYILYANKMKERNQKKNVKCNNILPPPRWNKHINSYCGNDPIGGKEDPVRRQNAPPTASPGRQASYAEWEASFYPEKKPYLELCAAWQLPCPRGLMCRAKST